MLHCGGSSACLGLVLVGEIAEHAVLQLEIPHLPKPQRFHASPQEHPICSPRLFWHTDGLHALRTDESKRVRRETVRRLQQRPSNSCVQTLMNHHPASIDSPRAQAVAEVLLQVTTSRRTTNKASDASSRYRVAWLSFSVTPWCATVLFFF